MHVHTPESGMVNEFGNDRDKYVQFLFKNAIFNNIVAIGITVYFTIDSYKKSLTDYLNDETKLTSLSTIWTNDDSDKLYPKSS